MHTPRQQFKDDNRAEVGIGTMIVFIATILVAAIAAGVLISTSQKLQAKSQQTGNEATSNVIGTLDVVSVQGVRSGTTASDLIDEVDIVVKLASGADPVQLDKLLITFSDGVNPTLNLGECGTVADPETDFNAVVLRGDGSDCGTMQSGDLVKISIGLAAAMNAQPCDNDDGLDQNDRVSVTMIPASGIQSVVKFVVPALGTQTTVDL